jgi:tetratricopeptide (TPR) repeat protein
MFLDIEAERIAEQAARLAYDNFTRNNIDCRLAAAAFENYARIASDKMAEQMQYLYGTLLFNCDKVNEAIEVLTQLAERSTTIWRDKASLELIKIKIDTASSLAIPDDILVQLRNFILGCSDREEQQNQLRLEALSIYCKILLSRDSSDSAKQVLDILDEAQPMPGLRYDFFRAQAMQQSGRLEESAHFMSRAVDFNDDSIAPQAVSLLSEVLDKIELWQQDANDFNQMLQNCATLASLAALAEFADKSTKSEQAALVLAEISILDGKKIPFTDENDMSWLRPKARLLMAQGNFNQAAQLWARIAEYRKSDTAELNHKSYGWWQAKFYELDCLANVPQPDKKSIRHAIEVLQSSYADIPRPWAEKLDGLREICGD